MQKSILLFILFSVRLAHAQIPQIAISRIDQMPDEPSPYLMRDWEQVAIGYDGLVYDATKSGDYLPLIFINEAGVNYPENKNFGLDTYVGTFSSNSGEAINVLPSLIGATLVGIDKTTQNGTNWVLMAQDFFNKRMEENVYLNNYHGNSGTDWWYDIMPNIYFYQLNDLYPGVGDANFQFTSIADQWLKATKAMGGTSAPWSAPLMDYRAWNLSTMTGLASGVKEPEAAGGIGWLLYHAYLETENDDYLKGAEWSMEFLNGLNSNPSYELQLPYGAYVAARMNAQIGTSYDVEKILNWTFDRGELRGWGTITGQWNGMDVSGLIGEANDQGNDYAFLMNGFQQAGALVPLVRYDKRFAHAIGKWILNLANASRLFYPGFLPDSQQDASEWSTLYDPDGYMGYEGLREKVNGNPGPFSTGDAVVSGWADTNLAAYGSSSVGIFGGIIKPTNAEKILQLNLLKTDYYQDATYPTYLYYNPYAVSKTLSIDVGTAPVDLYDVLTETFLIQNATGSTNFTIPTNQAIELVLVPTGGTVSYDLNKMLINDIVVDYMQSSQSYNYPPRIKSLATSDEFLETGSPATIYATVTDKEEETLTFEWSVDGNPIAESTAALSWTAPAAGHYQITCTVSDEQGNKTSSSIELQVVDHINLAPVIIDVLSNKNNINPSEEVEVTCVVEDPEDDVLSYSWSTNGGTMTGTGNKAIWQSPSNNGIYEVTVSVDDGNGGIAEGKLNFQVKDYSVLKTGNPIVYYPFTGNAQDHSGNHLDGQVFGAALTDDLEETVDNAYYFDGQNDYIKVENDALLDFKEAVTVSCWIRPENLLSNQESFILSHGSWQNRWKLSINSGKVRWTLKTSTVTKDVDSNYELSDHEEYHIAATYDGTYAILYLNGKLDSYVELNGEINTTTFDFLIGRMLIDDNNVFNYNGLIDEVLVYDYALSPKHAISLITTPIITEVSQTIKGAVIQVFPNPTSGKVFVKLDTEKRVQLLGVHDVCGRKLAIDYELNYSGPNTYLLDFSDYPNGIYYLQFAGLGISTTRKIQFYNNY